MDSLLPNLLTMVRSEPDYLCHLVVLIVCLLLILFRRVALFVGWITQQSKDMTSSQWAYFSYVFFFISVLQGKRKRSSRSARSSLSSHESSRFSSAERGSESEEKHKRRKHKKQKNKRPKKKRRESKKEDVLPPTQRFV